MSLIVFTAVIGMFLAAPGLPPPGPLLFGAIGIALVATSAAALNCLVEQKARRGDGPHPSRGLCRWGTMTPLQGARLHCGCGRHRGWSCCTCSTNPLTMWLTLATFLGYAVIYTIVLKPRTPQNIVIGGASGAMPPVLGWAAVTGEISSDALLLFLIIFAWTPPHFWALALYRKHEYARAGVPMLPVTHGERFTRLYVASLHDAAGGDLPAAFRQRHERRDLPGIRARAQRGLRGVRGQALRQLQRSAGATHLSAIRSFTCPASSPRCWSITTGASADRPQHRSDNAQPEFDDARAQSVTVQACTRSGWRVSSDSFLSDCCWR